MSLYATVPLVAVVLHSLLLLSLHPCGLRFGILEPVIKALRLHETRWEALPPVFHLCLAEGARVTYIPKYWSSYAYAAYALWFGGGSRYLTARQTSQSYQYEREVAQFLGVKHAHYVSSGTAALVVAIQAMGIGPGDEVIIPTSTWIATASSITVNGAIPVLAEIDESLGINPQTLESYITPRTKAVLAVHMQGNPCNITGIRDVARRRGLPLIEDNAQAFGSTIHGKMVGTYGVVGLTSINPSKPYHVGGQGGLVWTDDDGVSERMRWAIENRMAVAGGPGGLPERGEPPGPAGAPAGRGRALFAGHGLRAPSEWHAAFGRAELAALPRITERMQGLKLEFLAALKPEHKRYLYRQEDVAGDKSYTLWLLLKNASHKELLSAHLWRHGLWTDPDPWKIFFLPRCDTIMNRVSYHESGFPWVTEELQAPDSLENYGTSHGITQRALKLSLSFHNTPAMMRWMAAKVDEGLGLLE